MAASETNPWLDSPARVPTWADLGKPALLDEEGDDAPLKDGTQLYAAMVMMAFWMASAASLMTPSAVVTVRFSAGTPSVDSFFSPNSGITTEDFTFVENATGNTTVRLPIAKIPPKRGEPVACANEGTDVSTTAASFADSTYRGATVKTWAGGTLADLKFTLTIW